MRPPRGPWLVLAVALAGGCRKEPPPAPPAAPAPTLVQASGAVWRTSAAGERQPITGGALAEGDVVATEAGAGAILQLAAGRTMQLAPGARVKLVRRQGELVAELLQGSIVSRSAGSALPDVSLAVLTAFGIARIPAGEGEATIAVSDEGVRIDVALGRASFVDNANGTVTAGADESIEVRLGRAELVRRDAAAPAPGAPAARAETLEVMLSAERGALQVRAPGERGFAARRASPAPAGTAYRLAGRDGRARLLAPGLRARLEGEAAGRVGEATHSAEGRRFALALDRGAAVVSLEGGQAHELVLEGRAPVTVRATEPSTIRIVAGKRGPTVTVLAGAVDLGLADAQKRLPANARAQVQGARLQVGTRPPADVILPTERGLHVYADALDEVTLSWPAGFSAGLVEVASDPELKDVLLAGRGAGGQVTVPAPRRAALHWRVSGEGRDAGKTLVGEARFQPDRGRSVLDMEHPHNLITESGSATTVYFQGVVPALTLSYAARPGAASYRLRVFRAGDLGKPLIERVVADLRCAVATGALKEGSYLWHATPLDARGAELEGGRMNRLELVYDNALTRLVIGSPKPGEAVGREVDALGVAPLGSKLFINGKPTRLDAKGRFSERVDGASTLVFRVVDRNGRESYWVRKLRVGS